MTAGIDLDILDGTAPGGPLTFDSAPLSVDALFREPFPFAGIRRDFWTKRPCPLPTRRNRIRRATYYRVRLAL
ncbi:MULTISPECIES: hypothetical protein [unclassified Streptomyces]|uniref:hypothetical protein n=1 Tax=unclassified Streptomyces TaxID=2593676 RepID=UPI0013BE9800|nr:hypothetical protein [Streptomyces sp. CB09001]